MLLRQGQPLESPQLFPEKVCNQGGVGGEERGDKHADLMNVDGEPEESQNLRSAKVSVPTTLVWIVSTLCGSHQSMLGRSVTPAALKSVRGGVKDVCELHKGEIGLEGNAVLETTRAVGVVDPLGFAGLAEEGIYPAGLAIDQEFGGLAHS
ncbi:hypothetical protein F0562_017585 [Nyssa sinensis]|uniref:Uncharacterized protein n=1 Tax=Nyssa sinensis TaxID=561372 RepID=A0A5J4ZIG7_9ASTE|nr:hypothetical protein F0562_017585 [Nyssa sinensis]